MENPAVFLCHTLIQEKKLCTMPRPKAMVRLESSRERERERKSIKLSYTKTVIDAKNAAWITHTHTF